VAVGSDPIDVAFAPDGSTAYITDNAGGGPGAVTVVDTATRLVRATLALPASPSPGPLGADSPTSVAVSPDGHEIWISAVDDFGPLNESTGEPPDGGLVTVFSALTGAPMATIAVDTGPFFLALSPDGRLAYVAAKSGCAVQEIDTATFAVVGTVHWPTSSGCPYGLAASATDGLVYAVSGADAIFDEPVGHAFGQVDFAFGAVILHSVGADPVTLALSPGGSTADVVDAGAPRILVVDTADGAVTTSWALPPAPPLTTSPSTSPPATAAPSPGTSPVVSEPRL
jgi:DNA-binding beta-propeller fold protein YncE